VGYDIIGGAGCDFILHPSSFILHTGYDIVVSAGGDFILHPSSFILHPFFCTASPAAAKPKSIYAPWQKFYSKANRR